MKLKEEILIGDTNKTLRNLLPYILYENNAGTNGTVNLSDNINNYEFIEIYCSWYDTYSLPAIKLSKDDIKGNSFIVSWNDVDTNKIIYSKRYNISGTQITKNKAYYYVINTGETATWDVLKINKVIGYK